MRYILSVLGGGIRGLAPAILLADLEDDIGPLSKKFNLVVGTSTGGLLALCIGSGLPASRARQLYYEQGPKIFHRSWWRRVKTQWGATSPKYDGKELTKAVRSTYGTRAMGQAATNVMVTAYDTVQGRPVFIKSWHTDERHIPMWKAALATSAAPTYFPDVQIDNMQLLDGGLAANNPGMCALVEAVKLWPGEEYTVITLDCGGPGFTHHRSTRGWGLLKWAPKISSALMDASVDVVFHQMGILSTTLPDRLSVYDIRFPTINRDMDDASEDSLTEIGHAAFVARGSQSWLDVRRLLK